MTAFKDYAQFYDLLYGDKDYRAEAAFVGRLLKRWAPAGTALLEAGCGSGHHASYMAEAGYHLTGIDMSADMVELARSRLAEAPANLAERVTFEQGDIRTFHLGRTFSAAMSLFHVVSYLSTDADLSAGFANVRRHLDRGGTFVFDFWHAPAIIEEGPQRREKVVESDEWHIHRLTEPVWEKDRDVVRVNFHITATDKTNGAVHRLHEEHVMRYFFPDTLSAALSNNGFTVVECGEWLSGAPVRDDIFGVYMAARAE